MKPAKVLLLTLLIIAVYILHQDFWNWRTAYPLVFGFLPIGLAYHAGYSVLASILMAVLVRTAWPKHLEAIDSKAPESRDRNSGGHR